MSIPVFQWSLSAEIPTVQGPSRFPQQGSPPHSWQETNIASCHHGHRATYRHKQEPSSYIDSSAQDWVYSTALPIELPQSCASNMGIDWGSWIFFILYQWSNSMTNMIPQSLYHQEICQLPPEPTFLGHQGGCRWRWHSWLIHHPVSCWRWWWQHSWLTNHPVSCLLSLVMTAFLAHLPSSILLVDVCDDGIPGSLTIQCPACWRWWWRHSWLTYHPVSCLLSLVMTAFLAHLLSSVLLADVGDDRIPGSLTIQCPVCWRWWWWHSRLTYHPVSCLLTLVMMALPAHLPSSVLLVDVGDDGIPGSLTIQCPACWRWWWWHSRLTYHPVSCLLTLVMMALPAHLPSSVLLVDVGDDGIPGSLTIQCPACWHWWWWHSLLTYHPVSCLLTLVMMAFPANLPSSVLLVDTGDDGIPGSLTIQCPACWRWWWSHSWQTTTHHLGQPCSHTTLGHGSEIRLLFIDLTNSTQLKQIATQSKILTSNNAMPYNVVNFLQILTPHSSSMKANYRVFLRAQSLVYTLPVTVILYGIQGGAAITRSTFSNILTLDIP